MLISILVIIRSNENIRKIAIIGIIICVDLLNAPKFFEAVYADSMNMLAGIINLLTSGSTQESTNYVKTTRDINIETADTATIRIFVNKAGCFFFISLSYINMIGTAKSADINTQSHSKVPAMEYLPDITRASEKNIALIANISYLLYLLLLFIMELCIVKAPYKKVACGDYTLK